MVAVPNKSRHQSANSMKSSPQKNTWVSKGYLSILLSTSCIVMVHNLGQYLGDQRSRTGTSHATHVSLHHLVNAAYLRDLRRLYCCEWSNNIKISSPKSQKIYGEQNAPSNQKNVVRVGCLPGWTVLKPFKMKGCTVVPKFLVHGCADLARPGRSPNFAAVSNGKISSPKNDQPISLQISVYFFLFLCENLVNLLILYFTNRNTAEHNSPTWHFKMPHIPVPIPGL